MEQKSFVHEIKEKLEKEKHDEFLMLMKSYREKRITKSETLARLEVLLEGHHSLAVGLKKFLSRKSIDSDFDSESDDDDKNSLDGKLGMAIDFVEKMTSFDSFTNLMNKRLRLEVDLPDAYISIASILNERPDLKVDFIDFCSDGLSEDDESALIRISPSYVLLPLDVENIGSTACDVLNNVCACRPCINDNDNLMSYKEEDDPITKHENDMEDERYHVDLLFNILKSTADLLQKSVDILVRHVNNRDDGGPMMMKIDQKDYLKPMHLRYIENVYGDHGLEMIDNLQSNPGTVLPVVIKRLNQKQDELRNCYPHLNWKKSVIHNND